MTYNSVPVRGHIRQTAYKTVWIHEHTRTTASEREAKSMTSSGHADMESIRARRRHIAMCKAAGLPY